MYECTYLMDGFCRDFPFFVTTNEVLHPPQCDVSFRAVLLLVWVDMPNTLHPPQNKCLKQHKSVETSRNGTKTA